MTASERIREAREAKLYEAAYNAHERAESMATDAIYAHLRTCSQDALACLADPQWKWQTRSGAMSLRIIDAASEVLDEQLEAALTH